MTKKCYITVECEAWDETEETDLKKQLNRFVQKLSRNYVIISEHIEFIPQVPRDTPLFHHPV